tara:strand:+ start:19973 stop:21037 length:1065 start_codon:yes stop_codon:yes gene_type:complete
MKIFVTGGAGFIGTNLVKFLLKNTKHSVINIDSLTYASNIKSLRDCESSSRYKFEKTCITNKENIKKLFFQYEPDALMHLAAESHVDRSIDSPEVFLDTNIYGTYSLLESSLLYFNDFCKKNNKSFLFQHISTDEVYGSLDQSSEAFTESSNYDPSSPYSASKAASDHLVRAWHRTYKLPTIITNCSNNYGPYHFPEKLIPTIIISALKNKKIPIYGDGSQVRDWLFVEDHVNALYQILKKGEVGETYNIGGSQELSNLDVVKTVCSYLDEKIPLNEKSYKDLITFVDDRPGHDFRYAINSSKLQKNIGWKASVNFEKGIKKTVNWYIENNDWWEDILRESGDLARLGLNNEKI